MSNCFYFSLAFAKPKFYWSRIKSMRCNQETTEEEEEGESGWIVREGRWLRVEKVREEDDNIEMMIK